MSTWYKTTLENPDIINGKHFELQNKFEEMFAIMQSPNEMAMFGSEVDRQTYYFMVPTGSEIYTDVFLENYSAQHCSKPTKSECSLLVGNQARAMTWLN